MVPKIPTEIVRVWVPVVSTGLTRTAEVKGVGGEVVSVRAGTQDYCICEGVDGIGRLSLGAEWLAREGDDGAHRVRFLCGTEVVVRLDSPHQWDRPQAA